MVEYKVMQAAGFYAGDVTTQLNDLAKEGWRVVSSYTLQYQPSPYFVLEREKPEPYVDLGPS